jgi:dolichyl-phosphate-mannose-protein mannosyltransferase
MDVHPPLAKMLIALTGWLAGFDGEFDFKEIGKYIAKHVTVLMVGIILLPVFLTLQCDCCLRSWVFSWSQSFS